MGLVIWLVRWPIRLENNWGQSIIVSNISVNCTKTRRVQEVLNGPR
jgi:hypothetical protein